MPPKAEIMKETVLDAAFELVRAEGLETLTARNIAQKLKCSTQPIYSVYGNMEAVKDDVYSKAIDFTLASIKQYENPKNEAALNLAIGCLIFAKNEKQLFKTVYLTDHSRHYLKKDKGKLKAELYAAFLRLDNRLGTIDEIKLEKLFIKLSIFMIGIGAMINTNSLELDIKEAEEMIVEMYEALMLNEGLAN